MCLPEMCCVWHHTCNMLEALNKEKIEIFLQVCTTAIITLDEMLIVLISFAQYIFCNGLV